MMHSVSLLLYLHLHPSLSLPLTHRDVHTHSRFLLFHLFPRLSCPVVHQMRRERLDDACVDRGKIGRQVMEREGSKRKEQTSRSLRLACEAKRFLVTTSSLATGSRRRSRRWRQHAPATEYLLSVLAASTAAAAAARLQRHACRETGEWSGGRKEGKSWMRIMRIEETGGHKGGRLLVIPFNPIRRQTGKRCALVASAARLLRFPD